jgi:hypothetical protein
MSQPQTRQQEQCDSYDGAETPTTRKRFFHDHHPGHHRHRHQAAHSETEHDQHQCPAAAQAEHACRFFVSACVVIVFFSSCDLLISVCLIYTAD